MNEAGANGLEAVIVDLAGTVVDFGSQAPIQGFQELFERAGVSLSEAQIRAPMGAEKREHIAVLCQLPEVQNLWQVRYQRAPNERDIDRLYKEFLPLQIAAVAERSQLIEGTAALAQWTRSHSVSLGANTGYARDMILSLLPRMAEQGFSPESVVCAPEVSRGRPYPYMSLRNAEELGVKRLAHCVKVDDTLPGVQEGLNAGMWSVAVALSGNAVGLNETVWDALSDVEKSQHRAGAHRYFSRSGAHYVIDSVASIIPVLKEIAERVARGEKP
ncbi:MAG: phosphonoacetaldehyde hydrolase [Pseudomonadales bacterium]